MIIPKVNKFAWYDTETTGIDSNFDQILQFASIETDENLNVIAGSERNILVQPRPDVIPHPGAYLTHFINVDELRAKGISEFELAREVNSIFTSSHRTSISGYNTDSFDNEMVRKLFYRNMNGIYDFEFKNDNLKFDLFRLVQMVYSFRPEILNWQKKDDGSTSLKLEHISEANDIIHENAHDALSDVIATIEVAKKIKQVNPKLFNYALQMTKKDNVSQMMFKRMPLIHIDTVYGQDNNIASVIAPITVDDENKNKFLAVDLRHDPEMILDLPAEELRRLLFTKRSELPEDSPRVPIVGISSNKQPNVVDLAPFAKTGYLEKCGLDIETIQRRFDFINSSSAIKSELVSKLKDTMTSNFEEPTDCYATLYSGGFLSREDQAKRASLMKTSGSDLQSQSYEIEDASSYGTALEMKDMFRHFNLINRAKWNSFYQNLMQSDFSPNEFIDWVNYLDQKLNYGIDDKTLTFEGFKNAVDKVVSERTLTDLEIETLNRVISDVNGMMEFLNKAKSLANDLQHDASSELNSNVFVKSFKDKVEILMRQTMDSMAIDDPNSHLEYGL